MPRFSFVPFKLKPVEHPSIYSGFATPKSYILGAQFARRHSREFDHIEGTLGVPREAIAAILVVESRIGQYTGNHMVLYRLSRVASVGEPENLRENFTRMKAIDPSITFEQVEARAQYLEKRFGPEIPALIEIGKRNRIDILGLKGSIAGAFGIPQFLPSAFTRFAADGDKNGFISLFNEKDAIWSTARYLASYGYRTDSSLEKKRDVIWHYNKSNAYIDTVLAVNNGIRQVLDTGSPSPYITASKVRVR
jgi:membrane-bound lytic murein transglycosylase B